jgi:hypothetical protein
MICYIQDELKICVHYCEKTNIPLEILVSAVFHSSFNSSKLSEVGELYVWKYFEWR